MMKFYRFLNVFFVIVCSIASLQALAQSARVTGKVTSSDDGSGLPGVSILEKGTSNGTVTDADGGYSLNASNDAVLVFSFVGYSSQEVAVSGRTQIDVILETDVTALSEVVIVGYGEVKKTDATGSVASVSTKDFNKGAISSPQELIMGKVPGVVITTGGGAAGAGSTIRVRGGSSLNASNDPLIVVDGIPLESDGIAGMANPLSTINPNDIETFTVLKDASATAIYGSRASNGVIIITTKKGAIGKLKVNYDGNFSVGVPSKYMEVFNAKEYRELIQDRVDNHGLTSAALSILGNADTNWQKEIYQNAFSMDHNIGISGSLREVPYRVSVGYTNQDGLLKNNNFERTSINVSVDPSFLDGDLKVSLSAKNSFINNNFSNQDAIGAALRFDPTQPIRNGNTRYGGYTAWTGGGGVDGLPNNIAPHNPVAQLKYRDNTSQGFRTILGGKVDYKVPFLDGLKATLNVGYDYYKTEGDDVTDTLASWSYREPQTQVRAYEQIKENSLLDFYVNYTRNLDALSSKIDVTAGYSYQHFYREGFNSNRPTNKTDGVYVNASNIPYKSEYVLISFFGRANYTFKDKYLLTATLRNDHSSRFDKDVRSGLFPAVGLAWKLKEEGFLRPVEDISTLKLRMGWGQTGQQDIGDNFYPYIATYVISQVGAYYQMGDTFYPTLRPNAYTPLVKWETTTTQNLGLDFGLFGDRINGSFDVYKRITKDLLNEAPVAAGTNFDNRAIGNVGTLENTGFEVALNGVIIEKDEINWEIGTTFTYNRNEITRLTANDDPNYAGYRVGDIAGGVGNNVQIQNVGYPSNTFLLFSQVYDQNGMPIEGLYVDKSGLGGNVTANENNKYFLENPAPKYLIGISSKARYKNFDFAFSARVNLENYVYNNNASSMALYSNLYNQSVYTANILKDVQKTNFTNAQYWSDVYLENASFLRMDNISLGYNFDKIISEKVKGRVAFTVQNAFVITKYSGLDPEVQGGIDNNIYPRPRTFMLGLNLNF